MFGHKKTRSVKLIITWEGELWSRGKQQPVPQERRGLFAGIRTTWQCADCTGEPLAGHILNGKEWTKLHQADNLSVMSGICFWYWSTSLQKMTKANRFSSNALCSCSSSLLRMNQDPILFWSLTNDMSHQVPWEEADIALTKRGYSCQQLLKYLVQQIGGTSNSIAKDHLKCGLVVGH